MAWILAPLLTVPTSSGKRKDLPPPVSDSECLELSFLQDLTQKGLLGRGLDVSTNHASSYSLQV